MHLAIFFVKSYILPPTLLHNRYFQGYCIANDALQMKNFNRKISVKIMKKVLDILACSHYTNKGVEKHEWDLSSAGRASALQAEGHRFEPCRPHFFD